MSFTGIQSIDGGGVVSPQGFAAATTRAGIKTEGDDLALIVSQTPAVAAAVFTQNQVKAAPVLISARHLAHAQHRAIVANAGNANCCTGAQGAANAQRMCDLAAKQIGASAAEVLVCSTGIIGHALPMNQIEAAFPSLELSTGEALNEATARAVMTTDTVPKFYAARATINGAVVTVGGQAKGVGMIGPAMASLDATSLHATMLSFLTTDAAVEKMMLQRALQEAVEHSFNSVTVDGDTSTNDTCIVLANGASGVQIGENEYSHFVELLQSVCVQLAKKVARDGEGATKLVTIEVNGAQTPHDAKQIAMTVANSPLVKTAIFGNDPNWGRLAMAAGRAGIAFDAAKLRIQLGEVEVFRDGEPSNFDLQQAQAAMQTDNLTISIQVGEGDASWRAWTCDFSYDYVKINAEYHT
ncbi:MAG TPA: bifunctional glutamate N-acetyltransferase/amino-acid acetyltransferase ArgJ [Abditibacteriaceae bacterium]|jgi:glutamate N-acetyltransferase/amino-acid N-acetyltransferase